MQLISKTMFTVLLALCWSGLAVADPNAANPTFDDADLSAVTNMQLDHVFETFATLGNRESLRGLAGPSSMDCSNVAMEDGIETCIVTTQGPTHSMPAALAHN